MFKVFFYSSFNQKKKREREREKKKVGEYKRGPAKTKRIRRLWTCSNEKERGRKK